MRFGPIIERPRMRTLMHGGTAAQTAESQSRLRQISRTSLRGAGKLRRGEDDFRSHSLPELRLASPRPSLSLDRTWRANTIRVFIFERSRNTELARRICVEILLGK